MQQYLYLAIDLGCILIPVLFSFHPKIKFYKEWKFYFPSMVVVALLFLVWDEWFTRMGVWGFNADYVTGVYLGKLPIEEILFFICIPYACVFTYFTLNKLWPKNLLQNYNRFMFQILIVFSLGMAVIFRENWYTAVTFGSLAICLLALSFSKWRVHFPNMSRAYLIILPFFFLSNGLLTGSFIPEQVVWYDDTENVGRRMFTIPFEDIFYGFLLIVLNIWGYEWLKRSHFSTSHS